MDENDNADRVRQKHWERYLPAKRQPSNPADDPDLPRFLRLLQAALLFVARMLKAVERLVLFFLGCVKFMFYLSVAFTFGITAYLMISFVIAILTGE